MTFYKYIPGIVIALLMVGVSTAFAANPVTFPVNGGTGISTKPTYGQVLVGNTGGTYTLTATSSLGITGSGSGTVTQVNTTYPVLGGPITTTGTLSLDFGTTTSNTWSGTQTFTNPVVIGSLSGLIAGNSGTTYAAATSAPALSSSFAYSGTLGSFVGGAAGTLSLAANGVLLNRLNQVGANTLLGNATGAPGNVTAIATSSLGLTVSSFASPNISQWTNNSGYLTSAITALGPTGQTQTGATQTLASSTGSFNGLTTGVTIVGSGNTQTFTPSLSGTLNNAGLTNSTISGIALGSNLNAHTHNASLSGTSYNGSTAVSDWGLNLANPNVWTGLQWFQNATSSLFSVENKAYFGGTATTTIDSAGNIVVPSGSNLTVTGKSDGCATWATGVLNSTGLACGSGGSLTGTTGQLAYFSGTNTAVGTSTLFITPAGFVGVGTTSPSNIFTVEGNQSGGIVNFQRDFPGNTPYGSAVGTFNVTLLEATTTNQLALGTGPTFTFRGATSTANPVTFGDISGYQDGSSNFNGALGFRTYLAGSPSQVLTLLSNGNVGIGSTTPGTLLSLGNTGANTVNISATATSTFGSGINISTGCFAINGTCLSTGGSGGVTGTTGQVAYLSGTNTAIGTSTIFIGTNGNVGIGSTTPFGALSVNPTASLGSAPRFVVGSSSATSLYIDSAGKIGFGAVVNSAISSPFQFLGASNASPNFSVVDFKSTTGDVNATFSSGNGNIAFMGQRNSGSAYFTGPNGFSIDVYGGATSVMFGSNTGAFCAGGIFTSGAATCTGAGLYIAATTLKTGISTTSPIAQFTMRAASTTAGTANDGYNGTIFVIAGFENTVTKLFEVIDQWGHRITGGDTPTVSGGTSTVAGNDNNGTITVTGTLLTSVTLTFAHAWPTAPDCTMADSSTGVTGAITSISSTQVVIGFSAGVNSGTVWYMCSGHQ